MTPFLTLYTPTYRRPKGLAACLASVQAQTAVSEIEHLVIPDHVGVGIEGMYARVPDYVDAVHGEYVHLLADDDVLAGPDVVARVKAFAEDRGFPPVILVKALKGALELPFGSIWPPVCSHIDLGCIITRADVWKRHAGDYGKVYEGDYLFAKALFDAGHRAEFLPMRFLVGAVSRGMPEVVVA